MEQAIIFNQNLLKKGEYYRMSSTIFDASIIATCVDVDDSILVLEDDDKVLSRIDPATIINLGLQFENVTIHPHDDDELDII